MPPRQFSSRDIIKVLDKANWNYTSQNTGGSHVKLTKTDHNGKRYVVTVPLGYDPIAPRTLRSIANQAGANDFDEFCEWIDRER